jgi:hypothetical protein
LRASTSLGVNSDIVVLALTLLNRKLFYGKTNDAFQKGNCFNTSPIRKATVRISNRKLLMPALKDAVGLQTHGSMKDVFQHVFRNSKVEVRISSFHTCILAWVFS